MYIIPLSFTFVHFMAKSSATIYISCLRTSRSSRLYSLIACVPLHCLVRHDTYRDIRLRHLSAGRRKPPRAARRARETRWQMRGGDEARRSTNYLFL